MRTLKPKDYDDLYKTLTEISIPVYKKSANYMKYEIKRFGRQAFRITRDGQTAFTAGLNISRSHGCWPGKKTFEPDTLKLQETLAKIIPKYYPNYYYTSVQVNKNYPGDLHVDKWNVGNSLMVTVGDSGLSGGDLWCNGEIIKTNGNIIQFDGNNPHMTLDYSGGDRYSLVLFTTKVWHSALRKNPHIFPKLQAIGIPADPLHLNLYEPIQQTREERLNEATKTIIKQIKNKELPKSILTKIQKRKA